MRDEIKFYNPDLQRSVGSMYENSEGEWVRREDYEALQKKLDELTSKYNGILYEVHEKTPGQSRDETARKMIIKARESLSACEEGPRVD